MTSPAEIITCTGETPFQVALRLEPQLRNVLRQQCGSAAKAEDAWSDVVLERISRVCELHKPAQGPLDTYVIYTMRWYACKWAKMRAAVRNANRTKSIHGRQLAVTDGEDETGQLLDAMDLEEVLRELSDYDQWLIRTHALEGHPFTAMARVMGVTHPIAKQRYEQALARAAELGHAWEGTA